MCVRGVALVLGLSISGFAFAQDPGLFKLDTVLVASFDHDDPDSASDADRIRELLQARLSSQFITKDMSDVPDFASDYPATTYMAACPPGEHMGCAFVVGQRAGVDWVVTGTVNEDPFGVSVTTSFINIPDSEVLLSFGVTLDGENEPLYAEGVADVLARVVGGAANRVDVRIDGEQQEAEEQLRRAQAAMIAASLSELEEALGQVERLEARHVAPPRLTRDQLDDLEGREDGAPWERLSMSRAEYRRFRASGLPVDAWRARSQGRTGQVLARVAFGGGSGPFGQRYDGRYVLSNTDLSVVEVSQFQEVSGTSTFGVEFEAGFGVMRYLEVSGVVGLRSTGFDYLIQQSVQNDENVVVRDPVNERVGNAQFGGRATFVPMPSYAVRPTVTAGLLFWRGNPLLTVVRPPDALLVDAECTRTDSVPVTAPALLIGQVAPGVEVSAGKFVNLFARGFVDLPIGGKTSSVAHCGAATLPDRPAPTGAYGIGVSGQAGLEFRFGLIRTTQKSSHRIDEIQFEDEEF